MTRRVFVALQKNPVNGHSMGAVVKIVGEGQNHLARDACTFFAVEPQLAERLRPSEKKTPGARDNVRPQQLFSIRKVTSFTLQQEQRSSLVSNDYVRPCTRSSPPRQLVTKEGPLSVHTTFQNYVPCPDKPNKTCATRPIRNLLDGVFELNDEVPNSPPRHALSKADGGVHMSCPQPLSLVPSQTAVPEEQI